MIRSSSLAAIAERVPEVKKQETKVEPANLIRCGNCKQERPKRCRGLCEACHTYQKRHNQNRPMHLIRREVAKLKKIRWCQTCGNPQIDSNHMCGACRKYWATSGKARPKWLWDDEFCCTTCGIPKRIARHTAGGHVNFRKDKCRACSQYERKYGKPRPQHLWGNGSKGWCDCGYPAEHEINKIVMCNRCVKEYR